MEENFFKNLKNSIRNAGDRAENKLDDLTSRDSIGEQREADERLDTQTLGFNVEPATDNDYARESLATADSDSFDEEPDFEADNAATRGTLGFSSGIEALEDEMQQSSGNDNREDTRNLTSDPLKSSFSSRFPSEDEDLIDEEDVEDDFNKHSAFEIDIMDEDDDFNNR